MYVHDQKGLYLRLLSPAMFLIGAIVVLSYITPNIAQVDAMARGIAGPISWPRFALYGVILCASGWFVQNLILSLRQRHGVPTRPAAPLVSVRAPTADQTSAGSSELIIWIGIGLTLAYGFLIPVIGYPVATLAYILLWLPLGGIRKPVLISVTATVGTVVLLYIFVKLALMPLDRGQGLFGDITIEIYRFLKIY